MNIAVHEILIELGFGHTNKYTLPSKVEITIYEHPDVKHCFIHLYNKNLWKYIDASAMSFDPYVETDPIKIKRILSKTKYTKLLRHSKLDEILK